MTQRNDGGPAYPIPCQFDVSCGPRFESGYGGMSLRDYFAAKAMQGMLANGEEPSLGPDFEAIARHYAETSYLYADAMLAARERS